MKILSWGDRSELLTHSLFLQNSLLEVLEERATRRDFEQISSGPDFIDQIRALKTTASYILIESTGLGEKWPKGISNHWYRILTQITLEQLANAQATFDSITAKTASVEAIKELLQFLIIISVDLAQEQDDNW